MAESDPKKFRPFVQSPARRDVDSEDDPLVELARIVSEDSYYASRTPQPHSQPQDPIGGSAPSADLESELLQELDRSFAPRSDAAPPLRPAVQAAAPQPDRPPVPADDADDLLRSIEEQLGAFERRAQALRTSGPEAASDAYAREDRHGSDAETAAGRPGARIDRAPRPNSDVSQAPRRAAGAGNGDGARAARLNAAQGATEQAPQRGRIRAEGRIAGRQAAPAGQLSEQPEVRGSDPAVPPVARVAPPPENLAELPSDRRRGAPEAPRRRAARSGFAAGGGGGWREIESEDRTGDADNSEAQPARMELPREMRKSFDHSDDRAPLQAVASTGAYPIDRLEPKYADPTFGTRWEEAADPAPPLASDEPRVAPAFGAAGMEPPAFRRRQARRKGLMTAVALLAVVAIGGGVAAYMRTGEDAGSGSPPVIAAPEGADKVAAPQNEQQAEGETVGEAVYNRVAGTAPTEDDQVVDGAEEPQEISRIVPPAAEVQPEPEPPPPVVADEAPTPATAAAGSALRSDDVDAAADNPATGATPAPDVPAPAVAAPPAAEPVSVGPRRVRTFVVRPDGTIATVDEAPAGGVDAQPAGAAGNDERAAAIAAEAAPAEPVRVATTEIDGTDSPPPPGGPVPDAGFDPAPESAAPATTGTSAATGAAPAAAPPRLAAADSAPLPPGSPPAPAAEAATAGVAPASESDTPILPDLDPDAAAATPASPPPAPAAPTAAPAAPGQVAAAAPAAEANAATPPPVADGYVVQISSQRSDAQARAAYAGLQKRFPSVLGGLQPNIQEADLGAKGVFFRVRVGPYASRAEAIEICESLQAAGGSCFVTR